MNLETCRRRVNKLLAEYDHARRQVKEERLALKSAEQAVLDAEQAQKIVQELAQDIQQRVHHRLSSVVTRCLQTIFQENAYQFRMDFVRARGKTEARIVFVRDGKEIEPADAASGGAIDVASFALRIACLMLHRPGLRRLLVADEPMKHLSREYRPLMAELMMTLAEEMGLQIIMVTHASEFHIGKVIEL